MEPGPKLRPLSSYEPWFAKTGLSLNVPIELFMFGDGPELARELAELVAFGPKRATCGLPSAWTSSGEALPSIGQIHLVHDWEGEPYAIIENTRVDIKPLSQVDAAFAYDEGEGDRTLAWWQEAHRDYFSRECPRFGVPFDCDMLVVCLRFRRLFPAPDPV
jgi:uncharacterized protein YhfF